MSNLRDAILKALRNHTQNMEGYSYFGKNPGVAEDDYEDVADEIVAAVEVKPEKESN